MMRRIKGMRILLLAAAAAVALQCGGSAKEKTVTIPIDGSDYSLQVTCGPKDDEQWAVQTQVRYLQLALSRPQREVRVDLRTDGRVHVVGSEGVELDALLAEIDRTAKADKRITNTELKIYTGR